jgi:ribosomal protein S18 acetylase RimI-like enzyme
METRIEFNPSPKEIELLGKKLFELNREKISGYSYKPFIIKWVDDSGSIKAGIHCQIGGDWLYIESLWVENNFRHRGVGKQLVDQAEQIARQNKCFGVYLYTYSFQSPGFYEKLGYSIFGVLENFCGDNSKYYMKKILV